ncbi:MAG: hypothetical protein ACREUH_01575 [Burkholderiales bacterium]
MLTRLAKWTTIGALAVIALAVIANAFDEDVHPEVKAYLDARPRAVAEARNGYFQMVGLDAQGEEPHAAGRRHVAALMSAEARAPGAKRPQTEQPEMKSMPLPRGKGTARLCAGPESEPCISKVHADEAAARKLVADHALLVERYRALLEYPAYVETYRPRHYNAPIGRFDPVMSAQQLFHVQAALRLRKGKALQVAYDLERSLAFGRRMLAGSTTLIGKMLAAAHARRTAQFVSEALPFVARADPKTLSRLADALAPLSSEEHSFAQVYRTELAMFASIARICRDRQAEADAWGAFHCYFFQPNATLNRQYFTIHKVLIAMGEAPAQRFDVLARELEDASESFPCWSILYNPTGKVLVGGRTMHAKYVARVHDVDALFRVVALQAMIGERELKGDEVPAFLAGNVKRYGDPYSGKAMGWDAARRQLFFQPRGTPGLMDVGGVEKRFSAGL